MIKGYRNDLVYQLAQDSSNTSRGGKMEHYRIRNGLLYATTRGGEDCLYIPNGHGINGETLRELMISGIHTNSKGHHSADRNLRYASEYIYWPEMWKDFRDCVRQCELCQANKERNTLPAGDAQTLPFPSEIFSSYAIDFMGPFTKLKGHIRKNNTLRQGRPMRLAHLAHITSIANRRCFLILRHLTCRALTLS